MLNNIIYIKQFFIFCFGFFIVFLCSFNHLYALETMWKEVAKTSSQIQFIDTNSLKYNNRGILSVITKQAVLNPEDYQIIDTKSYLIAIDCERRLYSNLQLNANVGKIKSWNAPDNNVLIKQTILNSCSY